MLLLLTGCGTLKQVPCHQNLQIGVTSPHELIRVDNGIESYNHSTKAVVEEEPQIKKAITPVRQALAIKTFGIVKHLNQSPLDSIQPNKIQEDLQAELKRQKQGKMFARVGLLISIPSLIFPVILNVVALTLCVLALKILKKNEKGVGSATLGIIFSCLSILFLMYIIYIFSGFAMI